MAQIPPSGVGPPDEFIPVGTFDDLAPGPFDGPVMYHEPDYQAANTQYGQLQPHFQPSPQQYERYNDDVDVDRRISTLNIDEEPRERNQRGGSSPQRRKSVFTRRRSSSTGKALKSNFQTYQLYRLEKTGEDWNDAQVSAIQAPDRDIQERMKKARKKSSVIDQLDAMKPKRRGKVQQLLKHVNDREKDSDFVWATASIEDKDIVRTGKDRHDIRAMEVIFRRSRRPIKSKSQSESFVARNVDLGDAKKSKDKDRKDGKDKGGDSKLKVKDSDPFQASMLFSSDGKPLGDNGPIFFENGGLPPRLPKEEPKGKRLSSRSKSRNGNSERDPNMFGELGGSAYPHDNKTIPPPPSGLQDGDFDMQAILNGAGDVGEDRYQGRGRRDSGVDLRPLPIAPRGSLSQRGSNRRRETRSRSGRRSRSRPRVIYADSRGADHVDHYFHGNGSVSSNEELAHIRGELEELSTNTSSSIHSDYHPERAYSQRRNSSKYEQQPPREHYRGPTNPASFPRYITGERIMIPERRHTFLRAQRPVSLSQIPPLQMPLQRAITYGGRDRSPDRYALSPTSPDRYALSPTSPDRYALSPTSTIYTHRPSRGLELIHPSELGELERDRARERDVEGYIAESQREQELAEREWRVALKEQEVVERERRRSQGYFAPGGYNIGGAYGGRAERIYHDNGYDDGAVYPAYRR